MSFSIHYSYHILRVNTGTKQILFNKQRNMKKKIVTLFFNHLLIKADLNLNQNTFKHNTRWNPNQLVLNKQKIIKK